MLRKYSSLMNGLRLGLAATLFVGTPLVMRANAQQEMADSDRRPQSDNQGHGKEKSVEPWQGPGRFSRQAIRSQETRQNTLCCRREQFGSGSGRFQR